jgi:hypothetical protein
VRPLTDSAGLPGGAGGAGIEILSIDSGPGIAGAGSYVDGASTTATSGHGIRAIQRLASEFDMWSVPGFGVVLRIVDAGRCAASRF